MSIKSPPVFHPETDDDYVSWKSDIAIWKLYTDTKPEKLGAAVYLALQGKAREAVRVITAEEIGVADGYDRIIAELDKVYLKDETTRVFCAFQDFYEYRRDGGDNFSKFIVEYEKRYNKLKRNKLELPSGVQAFFLLKAANLTAELEKLARVTAKLEYDDMRDKLMKIFGDPGVLDKRGNVPEVKEEVFYGHGYDKGRGRSGRGFRGNYGSFRGNDRYRGLPDEQLNWREGRGAQGDRNTGNAAKKVWRCFTCGSTKHFQRECPQRAESAHYNEHEENQQHQNVHITLFTSKPEERQKLLVIEALGKGVLDSGCSKTVAGQVWLDEYLNLLSPVDKIAVREGASKSVFRFGDGVETKGKKCVTVPVIVGYKKLLLDIEVVDNDIPLLISKGAMKQMNMKIDFSKDTATIEGEEIKLQCTSTGHYCLPITNITLDREDVNVVLHLLNLSSLSEKEQRSKALKLHRQFSHASKEKLIKLLKHSGCADNDFFKYVEECCNQCELCQKYRKAPLRPAVGLPLAEKFNEVVCMDLKEFEHNKTWILHIIDAATRYSAACLVKSKRKDVIVSHIFSIWIAYFGAPRKFLSDNGGEFANEVMKEMNEKLGVETMTTAAESPFSNGIVERHNAILYETMSKTLEDTHCEPDMALAWGVSAKNTLQNQGGFSANQLVFGYNPNFPTVLTDAPPALEGTTSSDIVRKNLEAMHSARYNYMKAETSERIRRALRHSTRTFSDTVFMNGEKVFYKRKNFKGWKGPAMVIGQEGKIVLIRHGTAYYRCHPCHLMKVVTALKFVNSSPKESTVTTKAKEMAGTQAAKAALNRPVSELTDARNKSKEQSLVHEVSDESDSENENDNEGYGGIDQVDSEGNVNDTGDRTLEGAYDEYNENDQDERLYDSLENPGRTAEVVDDDDDDHTLMSSNVRPKAKMYVKYTLENGIAAAAMVLSQQPKRGSRYEQWINVQVDGENGPSSVNWNDVESWRQIPEQEHAVFLTATEEMNQEVVDAKDREIKNLIENNVYDVVEDLDQPRITTKWIFTKKEKEGQMVIKARIVARGFEERMHNARTDSPTCSRQSLRLCFVTASTMGWKLHSLDVTSAFLQGNEIQREVYLKPPTEFFEQGMLWKLKRCIYGLNDAPRAWYERVEQELVQLGGKSSIYDDAMFMWHDNNGELIGLLVSHVDDFVYCGTAFWHRSVMDKMIAKFNISSQAQGSFKYIGLNVVQRENEVLLDQHDYVRNLQPIQLTSERMKSRDESLTETERTSLRSLSGQILWTTTQTRPDTAYDACVVGNYGNEPTVKNIIMANKAIKKLKDNKLKLVFPNIGQPKKWKVITYGDAAHANLPSGASQGGTLVFLEGNGRVAPIIWQSKKLNRVTKSPFASETMAGAETADAGVLIAAMVTELFRIPTPTVECWTDSKSLIDHLNTSHVIQDCRLRVDMARIREMVKLKEIHLRWLPNKLQLADPLTKAGASSKRLLEVLTSGRL